LKPFNLLKSNERSYNPYYKWSTLGILLLVVILFIAIPAVVLRQNIKEMAEEITNLESQIENHPTIKVETQVVLLRQEMEKTIQDMELTREKTINKYILSSFLLNSKEINQIKLLIVDENNYNAQLHFANQKELDHFITILEKEEKLPVWRYSMIDNLENGIDLYLSWFWNEVGQE
jgi:hypothetical protein